MRKREYDTAHIINEACRQEGVDTAKYSNSVLMKTMAETPYRVKCKDPVKTGVELVALNIRERATRTPYAAKKGEWGRERLSDIEKILVNGEGNRRLTKLAMNSLYIVMLHDYRHDKRADKKNNKYNPLNDGVSYLWEILKARIAFAFSGVTAAHASLTSLVFFVNVAEVPWWDN